MTQPYNPEDVTPAVLKASRSKPHILQDCCIVLVWRSDPNKAVDIMALQSSHKMLTSLVDKGLT
ncbi:hypothetical protein Ct61P_14830 [Colletotrichum tofieldiae]|nr:hypothetical protein Ct61P_14830 [Colletotrichum tofieldiae]